MLIGLQFISGIMVGIEVLWGEAIVFDIGIIRLILYYGDGEEDDVV
jgi:hypothetical protein